jgi:hypothetical protein
MWTFLSHVATLAVVLFLWKRIEPSVLAIMARYEVQRPPVLHEPASEPASPRKSLEEAIDEEAFDTIPQELYQLAMQESEAWAREQTLSAMIQLKSRLKSWDRVRAFYASKDVN